MDDDPLLGFSAEERAAAPDVPESKQVDPQIGGDVGASAIDQICDRLTESERRYAQLESDVARLRSDVATLVAAAGDIHRPRERKKNFLAPVKTAAPTSKSAVAAVLLFIVMLAIGAWGALSLASSDISTSSASETETAEPIAESPAPVIAPAVAVQQVTPPVATPLPAPRPVPARRVDPDDDRPARVQARGYVGTLSIDAVPPGDVFVNRKKIGRTPLRLENLRAGSHLIWIERDGYRRFTRVVAVAANRVSRVSAELDPLAR